MKHVNTRSHIMIQLGKSFVSSKGMDIIPHGAGREYWQEAELLLIRIGDIWKFLKICKARRKFLSMPATTSVAHKI